VIWAMVNKELDQFKLGRRPWGTTTILALNGVEREERREAKTKRWKKV